MRVIVNPFGLYPIRFEVSTENEGCIPTFEINVTTQKKPSSSASLISRRTSTWLTCGTLSSAFRSSAADASYAMGMDLGRAKTGIVSASGPE